MEEDSRCQMDKSTTAQVFNADQHHELTLARTVTDMTGWLLPLLHMIICISIWRVKRVGRVMLGC